MSECNPEKPRNYDFDFERSESNDDEDVLLRLRHDNGTSVTFLTAPAATFTVTDKLEPLITQLDTDQIYVAFNEDLVEQLIQKSIEKNGADYGAQAAAFLPITKILNIGLRAVNEYVERNKK